MTCAEFESLVEALGRGEPMEEGLRRSALSHAGACAACSRQLDEARALTVVLGSMARANRQATAPTALEARLLEAFDKRTGREHASFWRRRWMFVAAAASLFLFGVALTVFTPQPAPVAKNNRAGALVPLKPAAEVATEFFPLQGDFDLPDQESSGIVRVTVPRTTLLAFGLPMNDERALEPLQAEILVGDDGAPRAIRFLNERP